MDLPIKELDVGLIQPNNQTMMKPDQGGAKIVVIGKPGCFAAGTGILCWDGQTKKVEDVIVGDVLMGDDGTLRNVQELYHDHDLMFRIKPEYGESYIVNHKHDLVLTLDGKSGKEIISVQNFLEFPKIKQSQFFLLRSPGIEWSEKQFSKDPYQVGKDLWTLGIYSKGIPHEYKTGSMNQRKMLIEGWMENRRSDRGIIQDKMVEEDVLFIARSLGWRAYRADSGDLCICCDTHQNTLERFVVEPVGYGEYFGFRLDGNHLFLLSSFDIVKNTGKTTLITSLLYEKRDIFPVAFIMSGTEDSNGHYKKIIPSTFVYNKLEEKKIEDFVVRQKIAKKHLENPWAILLLDDCTDDPKLFNKPLFQGLYKNGRHWKMWFILSLQYCMDIKPVIRTNVDGVFILRETNLRNRKSLWENYAGIVPDFSMFCNILDGITDSYTALYIHNATTSNKLEDCLFWYKAKPVPSDFKLGSKDLWKFHNHRFNEKYSDPYL